MTLNPHTYLSKRRDKAAPVNVRIPFQRASTPHSSGSALLVTLLVVSLLLVITLAFVALVRLELSKMRLVEEQTLARANARLAMELAISELQSAAGPDQRSTATADMAARNLLGDRLESGGSPANNDPLGQGGRGLTAVREGTRYWTGVWSNRNTPESAYTTPPSPALVKWLVSGNERNSAFTPATAVDWSSLDNFRLNLGGNASGILMVGPGTTGTEAQSPVVLDNFGVSSPTSADREIASERFVVVPSVPVRHTRNGAVTTTGHYAFWVGDEGIKARINLPDPLENTSGATALRLRARVAQRVAGEMATAAEEPQPASSPGSPLDASPDFTYDDYPKTFHFTDSIC